MERNDPHSNAKLQQYVFASKQTTSHIVKIKSTINSGIFFDQCCSNHLFQRKPICCCHLQLIMERSTIVKIVLSIQGQRFAEWPPACSAYHAFLRTSYKKGRLGRQRNEATKTGIEFLGNTTTKAVVLRGSSLIFWKKNQTAGFKTIRDQFPKFRPPASDNWRKWTFGQAQRIHNAFCIIYKFAKTHG